MRRRRAPNKDSQRGFALLMVFLMAAIIALMLYQQLPRVAFESERDKEQLLIDRGEQYTRAIQLYYLANNHQYPTSIGDLEKKEKRFLRRRYVDPFTGKDEWRIIHTNGGFLTDSLVKKPPTDGDSKSDSASNTTATEPPPVNAAVLQRPSDRSPTLLPGFEQPTIVQDPGQAQPVNTPLPPITLTPQQGGLPPITLQGGVPNQPGGLPPITLGQVGGQQEAPQIPGQVPGQVQGQGRPPQVLPGQAPGVVLPGQSGAGLTGGIQNGAPAGFRIDPSGQLVPTGVPGQPQGIQGQPLQTPPLNQSANQLASQLTNQAGGQQGNPNPALSVINQLLTNPRQTTTQTPAFSSGNQVGAIAGIASTHKGPSIKIYKDQILYEKWEFVFSPAATVPGAAAGAGAGGPGLGPGVGPGGTGNGPGRGPNLPGGGNQPGGGFGGPGFGGGPGAGAGGGQQIFAPGPGR